MKDFHLVYSGSFSKQHQRLKERYTDLPGVWASVEFGLRTNPFLWALNENNYGVALTKQFGNVPSLRIAYRVSANTVTLLAIEPQPI